MKNYLASLLLCIPSLLFAGQPVAEVKSAQDGRSTPAQNFKPLRQYYQLTVYHFTDTSQERQITGFLETALVPALHRLHFQDVGVFESWANDTVADKTIYVFVPLKDADDAVKMRENLGSDEVYQRTGAPFLDASYDHPPFRRMETILLRAFPLAPSMNLPSLKGPKKDRVYELRSYESPTAAKFENKVKMFNEGDEIGLFRRLNFNAIFYSEVIAGAKMPNLMYMTSFENKADRDQHWKDFGNDPYWKKLSAMPGYQNNVSHIDITFLYPLEFSDF